MRMIYQNKWHDIQFSSFTQQTKLQIAEGLFYDAFYKEFFHRYSKLEEIDSTWLNLKYQTAQFMVNRHPFGKKSRVLSIGCGLGIVEKKLIEAGYENLEVTEITTEALCWMRKWMPHYRIHVGSFPDCIPNNKEYDIIYMVAVEYFYDQPKFISFLEDVKSKLAEGGKCLLISTSFESNNCMKRYFFTLKDSVRNALEKLGFINQGCFWGYSRTMREFREAFSSAGLSISNEGVIKRETPWSMYWIEGENQKTL